MTFTPLVSPAVTPLDAQFQYPEFAVPGEYFSPLTSPALEAQNNAHQQSIYGALPRSDSSDTTSPIEMNIDFSAPIPVSGPSAIRKSKKRHPGTSKSITRAVRQSPSMKPQNRKKLVSSAVIPPKLVSGIIENAQRSKRPTSSSPIAAASGRSRSQESSEAGSTSPEPSSDVLMPPPATPRSSSSSKSPYLLAQQAGPQSTPTTAINGEPATPASLMKICKANGHDCNLQPLQMCSKEQPGAVNGMEPVREDRALVAPAKAAMKPILTPLDTSNAAQHGRIVTPASLHKAHLFEPMSSPALAPNSVFSSPHIPSAVSPSSALSHKRTDSKSGGREPKKRNTSVHVSPALRPKMSPNIKPLLPEGGKENWSGVSRDESG